MKFAVIIAIVAVAMIGIMIPSGFAGHNPETTLRENGGTLSIDSMASCVIDNEWIIDGSCPDEWFEDKADKEYYAKNVKFLEDGTMEGIVCKKYSAPPFEKFFLTEGWGSKTEYGKDCPEKLVRVMNSKSVDYTVLVDPYRIINCPEGTTSVSVGKNHECLPIKNENIFSDLTDNIISESSKGISEYSQDSDVVIKQNTESVKDTSDKKLVCPSNSYFGLDNDGNVVCRDLKTNEIVPSISTNKPIIDDSASQTTTQTPNPQKSPSFFDSLLQFFQNLFGGFSSEPIENTINQIPEDIPEKINQVVDDQLQQAEKLIPNVPINPLPTAECLSKEGEKRVTCLMGVNSNVKTKDWTYADYDYVVEWWERYCGTTGGFCGMYYDQIRIAYDHLYN